MDATAAYDLPLYTERLVLRRYTAQDLPAYHAYMSLESNARYLLSEALTLEECMARIGKYATAALDVPGDELTLVAADRETGTLLGEVNLFLRSGGSDAAGQVGEIGWMLTPQAQGHGYATEAARKLLELAFEVLGFHRVEAHIDSRNSASAALCKRLGLRREATFRENMFLKGEWTSEGVYAVLRSEWGAAGITPTR